MFKLLKYLKEYRKETILAPTFKLIEVLFELAVPLVVSAIIDVGIANNDKTYLFRMCIILIVLALAGLGCSVSAQFFAAKAAVGFVTGLRHRLFYHIQKLSFTQLDEIGDDTMITRLTGDINQVQTGINLTLRLLLRSPFVVFGSVIMAFTVDPKSAIVFVVIVPVLAVVIFSVMLICIPIYKAVQQRLDTVLSATRENLSGIRVIRAFCKEHDEKNKFFDKNTMLTDMQIKVGKISAFLNPATFLLINISVSVLIYIGALRVGSGSITSGNVVALYNYMSQILVELIKFASLIINLTKAIASGNRIQNIMEVTPDNHFGNIQKSYGNDYAIEYKNVTFSYSKESNNALNNISFKIKKGQTVGIIGSTGSGKTSLINLLPCFYRPSSGEVIINGLNVNNYNIDYLRSKIGIVSQKATLFSGTIRDNLCIGKKDASESDLWWALDVAQANQFVSEKSNGLGSYIEQDGKNLSGGQKQRISIARTILKKPEILILDDSSSALDYATSAALDKAIKKLEFNPTVLIVTQRVSAIRNADFIIVLDDGNLVGIGTESELIKNCEVYREIYNSQTVTEDRI